jgi:hypothetical protein
MAKRASPSMRLVQIPRTTRTVFERTVKRIPELAAEAEALAENELHSLALQIKRENEPRLLAAPMPPIGSLLQAENAANTRYLPDDRLQWWGAIPWPSGAITRHRPDGSEPDYLLDSDEAFLSEFDPALATIVGADLSDQVITYSHPYRLYRRVPWDFPSLINAGGTPNVLPEVPFIVTTSQESRARARLTMVDIELLPGGTIASRLVLVNVDIAPQDPAALRADLILRFAIPQRAVGLEYVFKKLSPDDQDVKAFAVCMSGFDIEGRPLKNSDGLNLESHGDILATPNRFGGIPRVRFIGLRDQGGGISAITLSYLHDNESASGGSGVPIMAPQIIYRVWCEPLPPAVVKQDILEAFVVAGQWQGGEVSIPLPPRCDRATVMLRGSRLELFGHSDQGERDFAPRRLNRFQLGVVDEVADNAVKLRLVGELGGGVPPIEMPPYRLRAYYTLLAWNSELVDLDVQPTSVELTRVTDGNEYSGGFGDVRYSGTANIADPCRRDDSERSIDARCGPLSGVLTSYGFQFENNTALNLDQLMIINRSTTRIGPSGAQTILALGGPNLDGEILWHIGGNIGGSYFSDHFGGTLFAGGKILSGTSLVLGNDIGPLWVDGGFEPRTDDNEFLSAAGATSIFECRIDADMAFPSVGSFVFEPGGPVGQLDSEIQATQFDGQLLNFQVGGGISTSSGRLSQDHEAHFTFSLPIVLGITRRGIAGLPASSTRDLRFDRAVIGTVCMTPTVIGALWNSGGARMLIFGVDYLGPQLAEFMFLFEYRGDILSRPDVVNRQPLFLDPGEFLLIGGRFLPQGNGPRSALLRFFTNAYTNRRVADVFVNGNTTEPNPEGSLLGASGFGNAGRSNMPAMRRFLITSDGSTPLLVYRIRTQQPFLIGGTTTELPLPPSTNYWQIEPGSSSVIQVLFVPPTPGHFEGTLKVETNAGTFVIRLVGDNS